ncbi:caspase domain-containing protein [Mycena vulgaris]|nr:caspase domain-containing protein [Mycena vulgaris]
MSEGSSSNGPALVFAIVIGINDYRATEAYSALRGAVNDARAFKKYLLDRREELGLQVPEENIAYLENEQATRENILSTFKSHFLENPKISDHGETTMILFYAGHGTRVLTEKENMLSRDGKVEAIAPIDERTTDAAGNNYVYAIPDYVLGWLLWELSEKKGRNITVIFDSCFSGGLSRDGPKGRSGGSYSRPVPLELDSHLWEGKSDMAASYRTWSPTADTHVLMAACRDDETALEEIYDDRSYRGRFTESLITWLRRPELENTTYKELFNRIPSWTTQHPICGGINKDRLIFNGNYPKTSRRTLELTPNTKFDPKDPSILLSYRVDMGAVEGVVPGTEFVVENGKDIVCTLIAHSVSINRTILIPQNNLSTTIPVGSRTKVSKWNNDKMILQVFIPDNFPHASRLFPTTNITRQPQGRKFVQAPSAEGANILLRTEGDEFIVRSLKSVFLEAHRETRFTLPKTIKHSTVVDELVAAPIVVKGTANVPAAIEGLANVPTVVDNIANLPAVVVDGITHLPTIIDGIAHFNYFLELHHGSERIEGVTLEMHRLKGKRFPGRKPDPSFGKDGNLVDGGVAQLKSDKTALYGFTIRNKTYMALFPYLFYFNPVKYTISCWYAPTDVHVEAPLQSKSWNVDGTLTLGMGAESAFTFALLEDEDSSSGFLKLYVSTHFIDLSWIQQKKSPFDPEFKGTGRLEGIREVFEDTEAWDAIRVLLTMTK